jgi:hypothetical protein
MNELRVSLPVLDRPRPSMHPRIQLELQVASPMRGRDAGDEGTAYGSKSA